VSLLTPNQHRRLAAALASHAQARVHLPAVAISADEATGLWRAFIAARAAGRGGLLGAQAAALLRQRAWRRSRGHLALGPGPISREAGLAWWALAGILGALAERRGAPPLARAAKVAALTLAAGQLAACTSLLGGNIKGSFACSAPGGTCAPSTVIDDQALGVIQNARPMTPGASSPAGPYLQPPPRGGAQTALRAPTGAGRLASVGPGLVHRERRVLKVVFPSYVDGAGNFHEPRVVHTLADQGGWMELSSGEPNMAEQFAGRASSAALHAAAPVPDAARSPAAGTRPDAAGAAVTLPAGLPDPRAVAEARARGLARTHGSPLEPGAAPSPLDAIRQEVDARLGQSARSKGSEGAQSGTGSAAVSAAPSTTASGAQAPVGALPAPSSQAAPAQAALPQHAPAINPPARLSGRIEE